MERATPLSDLERSILNRLAGFNGRCVVPELLDPDSAPRTRSQGASFSRCLRRLERRGLVTLHVFRRVKKNEPVGMIAPTADGLAVAARRPPPSVH